MIQDTELTYKNISNTFKLRHIFAHETATNTIINNEEINKLFNSNVSFLNAASDYINDFIYPNAPLTQTDMNIESNDTLESLLDNITSLNTQYKDTLNNKRQNEFKIVEEAWSSFMNKQSDFEANEYEGGSIMPTIFNGTASSLAEDRIKYLENLVKYADK